PGTSTRSGGATITTSARELDTGIGGTLAGPVNVDINAEPLNVTAASMTVTSTGILNIESTLDLDGALTMAAGSAFGAGTGTLLVDGTLTTNAGVTDLSFGGTLTDTGTLDIKTGTLELTGASNTVSSTGIL